MYDSFASLPTLILARADIIHHDVCVFDLNHAFSDEARRIAANIAKLPELLRKEKAPTVAGAELPPQGSA